MTEDGSVALALSAAQVAELLEYRRHNGQPNAETIRTLYRSGKLPAPIDPELPVRLWRWSRRRVEAYVDGG